MSHGKDCLTQKGDHIQAQPATRRHRRLKTLLPFIARIAPNALCYHPIQHQRPNVLLRDIVRWSNRRVLHKQEITLPMFRKTFR